MGFCMYMASHLWYYAMVYKVFIMTRYAIILWKVATALMHTSIVLMVLSMGRSIMVKQAAKIQLLGFILVTNQ